MSRQECSRVGAARCMVIVGVPILGLAEGLEQAGWHVLQTSCDVIAFAPWQQASVGLLRITRLTVGECRRLLMQGSTSHIRWIALLDPEEREDLRVRALVDDFCFDFCTVPVPLLRLLSIAGHAYGMAGLRVPVLRPLPVAGFVGEHPAFLGFLEDLSRVGAMDVTVLLHGETGTGKELAARFIHDCSARAKSPFFSVNCGSLAPNLVQSELFGNEKGAFTGAHERRVGYIEATDGGTLFLDEIGDMPAEAQVSMLRFLQEGTIIRLGGSKHLKVDARIVAATHVDLVQSIRERTFREDLYHRLRVCQISIPPLRERLSDLPLLSAHFIRKYADKFGLPERHLSGEALALMQAYPWPGNVRELENRICQGLIMARGRVLTPADMGFEGPAESPDLLRVQRGAGEKTSLQQSLSINGGDCALAAHEIGVSRATFYRLLAKHGISPRQFRKDLS
ncbi:sigma-54 dependent transcriptional regulator [Crenobacter caeni]|uniref:Sigma-54-dependent Fis family transcriptional regulator n=1 Tax=Crenobacter caeni TaxID=2705474 RepID=A0A6B2KMA6_9NEIS|nr:sigma-54 dependent transcriptional regulator [Crenobacter caeni]NDV11228.1 sigma-54-dependent Fis family transcriptional regulator [Crenobacter caeni]